ncbi:MAG: hypothetical protein ACRC2S_23895 [Waterburya sp.]
MNQTKALQKKPFKPDEWQKYYYRHQQQYREQVTGSKSLLLVVVYYFLAIALDDLRTYEA